MSALSAGSYASGSWLRKAIIAVMALFVLAPLLLIAYQSFLTAPFFDPKAQLSIWAYEFVFAEADFWKALSTTAGLAFGMTAIAVPLGALLAFLLTRTDIPGRGWLEPLLLAPIFMSPLVLAFGYVVTMGPVGFLTVWWKAQFGEAPWNIYSFAALIVVAGLTHAPHVYLYTSAALRSLPGDLEEAARVTGASPARVALDVSLPMIMPALLFSGVLILFLGFEVFGLPLSVVLAQDGAALCRGAWQSGQDQSGRIGGMALAGIRIDFWLVLCDDPVADDRLGLALFCVELGLGDQPCRCVDPR